MPRRNVFCVVQQQKRQHWKNRNYSFEKKTKPGNLYSHMATNQRFSLCSRKFRRICKCLVSAAAASFVVVYVTFYMNIDMHRSTLNQQAITHVAFYDNGFVKAIAARASQDRYIVLAMVDEGFVDMAINLHETGFRPHHIDNYLFVGVGKTTCEILLRQSVACFYYSDDPSAGRASAYGQADFKRKTRVRPRMILDALEANFTVVHTDVDVSFLDNPFNEIRVNIYNSDAGPLYLRTLLLVSAYIVLVRERLALATLIVVCVT